MTQNKKSDSSRSWANSHPHFRRCCSHQSGAPRRLWACCCRRTHPPSCRCDPWKQERRGQLVDGEHADLTGGCNTDPFELKQAGMHNIGRAMDAARLDQVCNLLWRLNKLHLRYDTNEAAAKAGNVQGWIKRWALGCVNSPPRSEASMTRGHAT